jgi:hypothetical protein
MSDYTIKGNPYYGDKIEYPDLSTYETSSGFYKKEIYSLRKIVLDAKEAELAKREAALAKREADLDAREKQVAKLQKRLQEEVDKLDNAEQIADIIDEQCEKADVS